jgi:type II secretion system protein L
VIGLFQQPRDSERGLAEQVQEFCTSYHLSGDTVLSCMPGDMITHRLLSLPFTQSRQVSQAIPFELEPLIPFDVEEMVIAEQVVQRTERGATVLAMATPKAAFTEYLATFSEAGVEPEEVSFAPLAALPLVALSGADVRGMTALLDVGERHASVALLQDGVLCGLRTLNSGCHQDANDIAALITELQWTLLVLGGNEEKLPTRFFVSGEGASFLQLKSELGLHFSAEVVSFQDLVVSPIAEEDRAAQGKFASCLGMGLREALGGALFGVNLRCGEFSPRTQSDAVRYEWQRLGRLAIAGAVAASLAFGIDLYSLNNRYHLLRQEIRRVFTAALPEVRTVVNEKVQLEDAIADLQQRRRLLRGAVAVPPLEVLRQLSSVFPENIALDLDEWTFEEDAVRLRGTTSSFEAAELMKTAAASLGMFRDVQLKDVKAETGSQKVTFGLQLFFKHEGKASETLESASGTGAL